MIETIHIKNFRGIRELKLENLGQINIIAGKNNASKSSILEALALFLSAKEGFSLFIKILREILLWRGWYGEKSIYDLFYKNSKELEVSVKFLNQDFANLTLKNSNQSFANKNIAVELKSDKNSWSGRFDSHLIHPDYISSILTSAEATQSNFEFITSLTLIKFGYIESIYSQAYETQVLQDAIRLLREAYPEVKSLSPLQKYNKWIIHV
ncbi:AAA family ATPase [Methanocaldococcus jannaschii]|nr:AAA family ATPase [Methanocaldococcus jannaschii]